MAGNSSSGNHVPDGYAVQSGIALRPHVLTATTKALLKALKPSLREDGLEAVVLADRSHWVFDADSTLSDTTNNLVLTPDSGNGRWLRTDQAVILKLPCSYATADAAVLFTVPEGFVLLPAGMPYWEVTTAFAGGSSSAIGIASSRTGFTAAGAVLGGAAGNVEADLAAGVKAGTIGTGFDSLAEIKAGVFVEGDTFTFERITSVFTSGAGYVCIPVLVCHDSPATP
jgi:hypothetical protein